MSGSWINWFVNLPVNRFVCRVPNEYVRDTNNLTGLDQRVPNFPQILHVILTSKFKYDHRSEDEHMEMADQLYGMIHARYILTERGIDDMCIKYKRGDFGCCPRIFCDKQLVVPVGLTDAIGESHAKVYCPRCQDIYQPDDRYSQLDGAMFGCSFPHMFFMQLPHLCPEPPIMKYTARLYGFVLHDSALLPVGSKDSGMENLHGKEHDLNEPNTMD